MTAHSVPIADDCYLATITGRIDGHAWRERPITVAELLRLSRVLVAACRLALPFLDRHPTTQASARRPRGEPALSVDAGMNDLESDDEQLLRGWVYGHDANDAHLGPRPGCACAES